MSVVNNPQCLRLSLVSLMLCWHVGLAQAQDTEAQAQDTEPVPAAPPPEAPPAPAPPPEAPPAPAPPPPTLSVGIGLRTGLTYSSENDQLSLDDGLVDQAHLRPYFSGQFNEHVSFSANFEVGTANGLGNFNILDAILQLRIVDALQIWIGQHITAQDRNNMNGPFYHNSWNFPITVQGYPFDQGARDRGVTVWGQIAGGFLKYYASAGDLQTGRMVENGRYSGRLQLNLLEPEPGYYPSGTYYGGKDVLALGAAAQYQKGVDAEDGTELDNDLVGYSFDLMFEKNFGAGGTLTVEGGYWSFEETGPDYMVNQGTVDEGIGVGALAPGTSYMLAASWLTPDTVGIGKIQPNARFQVGDYNGEDVDATKTYDIGVAYVVDGFDHRWHLNYRHQDPPEGKSIHMFQVGAQVQMWN